jgi:hypothetical protein
MLNTFGDQEVVRLAKIIKSVDMYWDYRDELSNEQTDKILEEGFDGYNEIENELYEHNYDYIRDTIFETVKENIFSEIQISWLDQDYLDLLAQEDVDIENIDEIKEYIEEQYDDMEEMYETAKEYIDFNMNMDDLISNTSQEIVLEITLNAYIGLHDSADKDLEIQSEDPFRFQDRSWIDSSIENYAYSDAGNDIKVYVRIGKLDSELIETINKIYTNGIIWEGYLDKNKDASWSQYINPKGITVARESSIDGENSIETSKYTIIEKMSDIDMEEENRKDNISVDDVAEKYIERFTPEYEKYKKDAYYANLLTYENGRNIFHWAAIRDDEEEMEILINSYKHMKEGQEAIYIEDEVGMAPVEYTSSDKIQELLDLTGNIRKERITNELYSSIRRKSIDIKSFNKIMIDENIQINEKEKHSYQNFFSTALQYSKDNQDFLLFLLDKGINISRSAYGYQSIIDKNNKNETPYMLNIYYSSLHNKDVYQELNLGGYLPEFFKSYTNIFENVKNRKQLYGVLYKIKESEDIQESDKLFINKILKGLQEIIIKEDVLYKTFDDNYIEENIIGD